MRARRRRRSHGSPRRDNHREKPLDHVVRVPPKVDGRELDIPEERDDVIGDRGRSHVAILPRRLLASFCGPGAGTITREEMVMMS